MRSFFSGLGAELVGSTPARLAEHTRKQLAVSGKVIPNAGIKPDGVNLR